jgi:hypothetical protein
MFEMSFGLKRKGHSRRNSREENPSVHISNQLLFPFLGDVEAALLGNSFIGPLGKSGSAEISPHGERFGFESPEFCVGIQIFG